MGDDTGACEALLRYRAELGIKDQGGWTELHQVGRINAKCDSPMPCINRPLHSSITVDREIFTLKIIHVKIFCVVKFSWFCSIREIFLTVDGCNIDKRLESSWRLVYYQVSGKRGIAGCSRRLDIYPGECGLGRANFFTVHLCIIYILCVKFSRLDSTAKLF